MRAAVLVMLVTAMIAGTSAQGDNRNSIQSLLAQIDSLERVQRPDSAVVIAREALVLAEREYGHDDTLTAQVIHTLGRLYYMFADYKNAEEYWIEALRLREALLGPEHIEAAKTRVNIGVAYLQLGHYERAAEHIEIALPIMKREFGEDHLNVGRTMLSLGNLYFLRGQLTDAEATFSQALRISEKQAGPDSWEAATSLMGLATVTRERGRFEQAEKYYRRTAELYRSIFGGPSRNLAETQHNIGRVCRDQGKLDEALAEYLAALETLKALPAPGRPDLAATLNNLGRLYLHKGDLPKAEEYINQAREASRDWVDADHPLVALCLVNLGQIRMKQSRYAEADSLLAAAMAIQQTKFGFDHPEYAATVALRSRVHRHKGELSEAVQLAEQVCRSHWRNLRDHGPALSERDALVYAQFLRRSLGNYLSTCLDAGLFDKATTSSTVGLVLSSKGEVSEAMVSRQRDLLHGATSDLRALLDSLNAVKFQLSREFVEVSESADGTAAAKVDSLSQLAQRLEADLSLRSAEYRAFMDRQQVTAEGILDRMPGRSALVEYVRYGYPEMQTDSTVPRYAAVILQPGAPPVLTDLGPAEQIDRAVDRYHQHMMTTAAFSARISAHQEEDYDRLGAELYHTLWAPIRDQIEDAELVFIAPDGAINLVSFAGIPAGNGKYLIEKYAFHYLSSARDLRQPKDADRASRGLLALGDPAFEMLAQKPPSEPQAMVHGAAPSVHRTGCLDLGKMVLSPLPDTRTEVAMVADRWRQLFDEPVTVLLGLDASEQAFKSHAPGCRVMHLATHGYFLEGSCLEQRPESESAVMLGFAGENPLLLSGLFLAGAAAPDSITAHSVEDGVLTAYEITALDLTGTELVVLSACETALGKVEAGEGVYGLRRAFQVAGTETVISALWPLTDESAAAIMGRLYQHGDVPMPEIMRALQLARLAELRYQGKSDHPAAWASFVAVGDWR